MKYLSFVSSLCFFLLFAVQSQAQQELSSNPSLTTEAAVVTDVFMVYGNCGMCERRIESNALGLEGVRSADWDRDTKMLTVTYADGAITTDAIKEKLATVGHDTDKFKATQEVYDKLPMCCQYERPVN